MFPALPTCDREQQQQFWRIFDAAVEKNEEMGLRLRGHKTFLIEI